MLHSSSCVTAEDNANLSAAQKEVNQPLDTRNKDKTVEMFKKMLHNRSVPTSVWTEYMRAVRYSQEKRIEVVAKQGVLQEEADVDGMDDFDAEHGPLRVNLQTVKCCA